MTKEDLTFFKNLLLSKRKELQGEMDSIKKSEMESSRKEASGDLSSYTFHLVDMVTDSMEQEKQFLYAQRDGRLLYHIDEALDRIAKGIYGRCENCKKEISKIRLEALPHARLCIECKVREEGLPSQKNFQDDKSLPIYDEEYEDSFEV
jgi:RNA polymerase-binding protein DksA